jgi:hypothetical protein
VGVFKNGGCWACGWPPGNNRNMRGCAVINMSDPMWRKSATPVDECINSELDGTERLNGYEREINKVGKNGDWEKIAITTDSGSVEYSGS